MTVCGEVWSKAVTLALEAACWATFSAILLEIPFSIPSTEGRMRDRLLIPEKVSKKWLNISVVCTYKAFSFLASMAKTLIASEPSNDTLGEARDACSLAVVPELTYTEGLEKNRLSYQRAFTGQSYPCFFIVDLVRNGLNVWESSSRNNRPSDFRCGRRYTLNYTLTDQISIKVLEHTFQWGRNQMSSNYNDLQQSSHVNFV